LRKERRLRVFENRVLRRTYGPKTDEVTVEWRRLHNEELIDLYSSPNIIRVIKSRITRWAGHVARMEDRGARFWWGDLMERSHLEDLGLDERIILKWIFRARSGLGWGQVAGDCEYSNGQSDSIKCEEFHYYLRIC
jgi:hypothetical protein